MTPISIVARDIPEAWFLCLSEIVDKGKIYTIDRGSYAGQQRLEFDHVTVHIKYPGTRPLLPEIPPGCGIPNPVETDYLTTYLPYLINAEKKPGETYTYGSRLHRQIDEVIDIYKRGELATNQACMEVGSTTDLFYSDPPCLRLIDTRVSEGKLHFILYFRSWDLWGGFPANLGAIQMLKEYMASEIGVGDGEIVASSKGLHVYDYVWDLVEKRVGKKIRREEV